MPGVDLTDPRTRAEAARLISRELRMGVGVCPDRAQIIARRCLDRLAALQTDPKEPSDPST